MSDKEPTQRGQLLTRRRELLGVAVGAFVGCAVNPVVSIPSAQAATKPIPTKKPTLAETSTVAASKATPNRDSGDSRAVAYFVALTDFSSLPASTLAATKRSILDAIGVSLAAAGQEPVCKPFIAMATDGGGGARVLGSTNLHTSPSLAALANGSLAHALDYEDSHAASFTHPNAAPVAAAISLLDGTRVVSGERLISAIAVGCDLTCRLSLAQGNAGVAPTQFYPPAIVGTMGAVATAAHLLRLPTADVINAFALALCNNSASAAILFAGNSDIPAVRDGFSAQAGVQAALLAAAGVQGFAKPFEGEGGFFDMYSHGVQIPGVLTDQLGSRFAGDDVGYKAWPACRATHKYIQAILSYLDGHSLSAEDIDRIDVFVQTSDLIVCEPAPEKRSPRAAINAKFSIYFVVAAAIVTGKIDLSSFAQAELQRDDIRALSKRVQYQIDDVQAQPRAEGGGTLLRITLKNGSKTELAIDRLYGNPDAPFSDEVLVQKFIDCAKASPLSLSNSELAAIAERIMNLEQERDVTDLIQLLSA